MARGMTRSCLGIGCLLLGIIVATARAQAVIGFHMEDITMAEGATETVTVSVISGTLSSEVVVVVTIEGGFSGSGLASSGDHNVMAMDLTFSDTVTTHSIAITAAEDDILEVDEVFTLSLTTTADDTVVTLNPSSATVIITDMTMLDVRFEDTIYNADEGATLMVNVLATGATTLERDVVVMVMTEDDTAVAGTDYVAPMDITFDSSNPSSQLLTVMTIADTIVEGGETFFLMLSGGDDSVNVDSGRALVTINDRTTVTIGFQTMEYTVTEGGSVTATVISTGATLARDVIVAVSGSVSVSVEPDMVTLSGGSPSRDVTISAPLNDVSGGGSGTVSLSDGEPRVTLSPAMATVTVEDATVVLGFAEGSYTFTESEGTTEVQVSVTANPAGRSLSVTVTSINGDAVGGEDFETVNTVLMITPGISMYSVPVTINEDSMVETDEMFSLSLTTTEMGTSITPDTAMVTITDTTVMLGFAVGPYVFAEGQMMTSVQVTVGSNPADRTVIVNIMSVDNSATGGMDFDTVNTLLMVTPALTNYDVPVTILMDTDDEPDEMFSLSLTAGDGVSSTFDTATITITDTTVRLGFKAIAYTFTEGELMTNLQVTVEDNPANRSVSVILEGTDGTAFSGTDFNASVVTSLLITPANTIYTVPVIIIEDGEDENEDQMFSLTLATDDEGVSIIPDTTIVTITDTTILVTLDRPDGQYTVVEGESVYVTISTVDTESFVVTAAAKSSDQISFTTENFVFTPSAMSHTFTIMATTDQKVEGLETVTICLSSTANVDFEPNDIIISIDDRTILPGQSPKSQAVIAGTSFNLMCTFEAGFEIKIEWLKDGDLLSGRGTTNAPDGSPGNFIYTGVLNIDAAFLDCGSYSCRADGILSEPAAILSVVGFNDNETSDMMQMSSVGAVGMLSCSIRSCGTFSIDWNIPSDDGTEAPFPNTTNTTAVENTIYTNLIDRTSVITINTLGLVNSGVAQECVAVYDGAVVTRRFFDYTLQNVVVDEITVSPVRNTTTSFHQGDNVTLTCNATNPPDVTRDLVFTWVLGSDELPSREVTNDLSNGITVVNGGDYSILSFMDIQDDTDIEGLYMCRVTNRQREDWVTVTVTIDVISGPVIIFPGDNRNRVNAGEDVTLICDTRGSNPDVTNITISSGGVDLKSTNSSQMLGYTVVNASLNDNATNYTCTAFNSLGENPKTFSLVVQARPDMVDNSTVVSTLLSLLVTNLTWSPPLENNSPITSYTVTTCNPNTNCLVEQPSAPYLILYVLPEESYTVTITATNGVGTSDPSETVVIYGAMNDDANANLSRRLVTDQFVLLQWSPPRLAGRLNDDIIPDKGGQFNVMRYMLKINDEILDDNVPGNTMEYLYEVPVGGAGGVIFRLVIEYSDSQINDRLDRETFLAVTIPTAAELEIPAINTMMPEPYIRTSQGFTFTWNEPALLEDPSFLSEYRVMIVLVTGHQKRQTSFITTTDHNTRKYTFDQGMPHTTYSVSVDGVVNRNGVIATVPALTPSNLTTAQARLNCSARGISDVVLECEDIGSAATVLCSFDTGPQHSCSLPLILNSDVSPLGSHSVRIVASTGSEATIAYTIITAISTVSSRVPPLGVYMIRDSPRVTRNNSIEAEFETTRPVAGVHCFLRSKYNRVWHNCSSGQVSFSNLQPGLYVLKVHAYNRRADAAFVKRGLVITSDPTYCSLVLVNQGVRVSEDGTSAKVEFQLYGPATQLLCSLDGGTPYICVSPVELTMLSAGRHMLEISPVGCSGGSKSLSVHFTVISRNI